MQKINFTKMVASGNDFLVVDCSLPPAMAKGELSRLAKKMCDRKYGIGADGLLVAEKSKTADIKMRIFNPDGSEAGMCGNGARCFALWAGARRIETMAGIIEAAVNKDRAKIKLTDPRGLRLNIPLKINARALRADFINTGVPHAVVFVEGLESIDVPALGRPLRYHRKFYPAGTNVDFVEVMSRDSIKARTYERGVEDETLACGTGAVASAIISSVRCQALLFSRQASGARCVNVCTQSGEILKVYFDWFHNTFSNVWLEGKAKIICKGAYYV